MIGAKIDLVIKMMKEYLEENKMSIYKLSELSNVPYTTLNELVNGKKRLEDCKIKTISSIAKALNISIEALLKLIEKKEERLSTSWQEKRNKAFIFPLIKENKNYDASRIHPLKQRIINDVYDLVSKDYRIKKVIIFGSSVNIRCNRNSDIDIGVLLKEDLFNIENKNQISEAIQKVTDYNSDIIWLNSIDKKSQLFTNIYSEGVIIYE